MDAMLPSRLGKLRIVCSLPLFSDAICIKRQSAAEHGFTQVLLSIALAPTLDLPVEAECDLIELAVFAELPKALLGDPSYYLRQRHPEAQDIYAQVRGRLWRETEESLGVRTTRSPELFGVHELVDRFSAMLFIDKESLLGNQFFQSERYRTGYHRRRRDVVMGKSLSTPHPASHPLEDHEHTQLEIPWMRCVGFLDSVYDEATRARLEGGLGEYSATFLGMMEKLKEHYRYKGWSYHFPESVGEHTFQVVFLARLAAQHLRLTPVQRVGLYRLCAMHDLAEAYASDVVYPVKVREKDLGRMHQELEDKVINDLCRQLGLSLPKDPYIDAIMHICDRVSAQLYFDRERRSGNAHFNVPNTSMESVRRTYGEKHPEVFRFFDELMEEYLACFEPKRG